MCQFTYEAPNKQQQVAVIIDRHKTSKLLATRGTHSKDDDWPNVSDSTTYIEPNSPLISSHRQKSSLLPYIALWPQPATNVDWQILHRRVRSAGRHQKVRPHPADRKHMFFTGRSGNGPPSPDHILTTVPRPTDLLSLHLRLSSVKARHKETEEITVSLQRRVRDLIRRGDGCTEDAM